MFAKDDLMDSYHFARAWREHQRDLAQERRVFKAFALGVVTTAAVMSGLFFYLLVSA